MRLKALKDRVVNGQALHSVARNGVQVWRVEDLPR
jgi:hypothetical protein